MATETVIDKVEAVAGASPVKTVASDARRVKVYSFGQTMQWEDMGTGHVSMDFVERNQTLTIMVRSEQDRSILLESKVLPEREYKTQEETLIVWTEDDNCDLALSFQDKSGCEEFWTKICEVQGHNPELSVSQDFSEDGGDLSDPFDMIEELPPCELSELEKIAEVISLCRPVRRQAILASAIEKEDYISKLIDLFHICEDLENIDGLHHLYEIFKAMFFLNQVSLLQVMFQDHLIMDVIGCLEYDPTKPQPVQHREYLSKISQHREVVPFSDPSVIRKIHQTYRVQYIQEVILPTPSLFEVNMLSSLSSFLLFNKTEIINSLQEDSQFFRKLFAELTDNSLPEQRYREVAHLLQEVCLFSLALEVKDRTQFYQKLASHGLMDSIEGMLVSEDGEVVATSIDILCSIAEFSSCVLRDRILQENCSEDNQFLNIVISLLVDGEYPDLDIQIVGLVKTLIDPENLLTGTVTTTVEKSLFLQHFYKHSMHRLMAPLMAQTASETISKDTSQNAALLSHILDILSRCVESHSYHIKNYIIDKNILARVLVLMTSTHGHLALAALRFCRKIVGLRDEFYNRYITRNNLFGPIVRAFLANGQRYNLINSAIIELFEYITKEKVLTLVNYSVENFMGKLEEVEYVQTFKRLKLKYDQSKQQRQEELQPKVEGILHSASDVGTRFRRDPRQLDESEEAWFDEEEEFTLSPDGNDAPPATSSPKSNIPDSMPIVYESPPRKSSPPLITPVTTHTHTPTSTPSPTPFTTSSFSPRPLGVQPKFPPITITLPAKPTITAALKSLADYDEDSDEENGNEDESPSPAKRQKIDDS